MPGTLPLRLPPADIDHRVLDIVSVPPQALMRVSRYNTGEPFFGRTGACRFDDVATQFGTCYLGFDLTVAFAKSVLHNKEPDANGFAVPGTEIDACFALSFAGKDLKGTSKNPLRVALAVCDARCTPLQLRFLTTIAAARTGF